MSREGSQRQKDRLSIDISYILRRVERYLFVLIMSAVIVCTLSYIVLDFAMQDSYTASVTLSVLPRDTAPGRLAAASMNSGVERNLNVLNSDTLKEQMKKQSGTKTLKGTVSAVRVGTTNLITLNATSNSAQEAFRLLRVAEESYPLLSGYFEKGYLVRDLNAFTTDNIGKIEAEPLKYALLAGAAVLLAGIAVIVLAALNTDKLHNEEQAAALLDMEMLGTLDYVKKAKNQKAVLVNSPDAQAAYIEEIDKLSTRVRSKMDQNAYKTLLVSSVEENAGKTTAAVNLALNLARRGKRILLIDCDLRRPALVKILEKDASDCAQVSDFLEGNVTFGQVAEVQEDLYHIVCLWQRSAIADPDRLLEGETLRRMLGAAVKYVDYVIIDTPPIGVVRDTEVLASVTDAAMIVIRQDEVHASAVNDVVDLLEEAGTNVIGGVLNMAKGNNASARQSGKYGKYYYGYSSK